MAFLLELEDKPIRINERGQWLHGDEPLHPRVERLFSRSVALDDNDHYIIQLQFRRAPVEVDDTAFFVRSQRIIDTDGVLHSVELSLSDDKKERLDPSTLMQSADNVFYCRIKRQQRWVPCRFSPQQYHELALHAEQDEQGAYLEIAGERWRFAPYDSRPTLTPSSSTD